MLVSAGQRQSDRRHHHQAQMHDRPGQGDEQLHFRLIGHAGRNQSADRPENHRVDFAADADRRQRVGRFVQAASSQAPRRASETRRQYMSAGM